MKTPDTITVSWWKTTFINLVSDPISSDEWKQEESYQVGKEDAQTTQYATTIVKLGVYKLISGWYSHTLRKIDQ